MTHPTTLRKIRCAYEIGKAGREEAYLEEMIKKWFPRHKTQTIMQK
jgi:hypothetical protein